MNVRVRFAPSPTGPLHIGGVRTALYNYLFAKRHNGTFILRIEDTDQVRYVEGAEKYIIDSLNWLGIKYNEGVGIGGKHEPYRQSERKEIYKKYVQQLIDSGNAYYAFDTPEELEQMRLRLESANSSVRHYNYVTRNEMKNSFTISAKEVKQMLDEGKPYVVRFNIPENKEIIMQDIIRGEVKVNSVTIDDKVLFKSDGLPTYHLANIVDDHLMEISHVIRGEEWLPSLPLHILLYEAFGWEPPKFAHLPLILKPNGKGKLSKRDGDQLGFPVFPMDWSDPQSKEFSSGYKEWGYIPEAVVNMIAMLGWNPGVEQEIFTIDELAQYFDLEKVQKGGAKFDPDKTKWFNQQYLRNIPSKKLAENFQKLLIEKNIECNLETAEQIIELVKDRAVFEKDIWENSKYFFVAPDSYSEKAISKFWKENVNETIKSYIDFVEQQNDFSVKVLEEKSIEWIQSRGEGLGKVLNPIRILLVGDTIGVHLFNITEIIGKAETLKRLKTGLEILSKK